MNHTIATADRNTHLKMVVVALVGAILVVVVGITAHLNASVELAGVNPNPPTKVGVVRAAKPAVWTSSHQVTIR